jgi:hypothetical protein
MPKKSEESYDRKTGRRWYSAFGKTERKRRCAVEYHRSLSHETEKDKTPGVMQYMQCNT